MGPTGTVSDLPALAGLLPHTSRAEQPPRPRLVAGPTAAAPSQDVVLRLRSSDSSAAMPVNTTPPSTVSSDAATFEVWIRTTQDRQQVLMNGGLAINSTYPLIVLNGDQPLVYWNQAGGAGLQSADTTPVTDGAWHHLAIVFSSGTVTFYKDGLPTDSLTVGTSTSSDLQGIQLGSLWGGAAGFVGDMYGARIWGIALSADDIANGRWATLTGTEGGLLAASEFTSEQVTNIVIGVPENLVDASGVTSDVPSPSCVISLTGADADVVRVGSAPLADSDGATIECWMKMSTDSGVAATTQSLVATRVGSGPDTPGLFYAGGDRIGFRWGSADANSYVSTDTSVISDGAWHHIAVTFNSGWVQFFKDGQPTADSFQLPAQQAMEGPCTIGSATHTEQGFEGQICGVRIWTIPRTAADLAASRFTPLTGTEDGLGLLVDLSTCDPSQPVTMVPVNVVDSTTGALAGGAAVIQAPQPVQPVPQQVWIYQTPGVTPVGPVLSSAGVLCSDNDPNSGNTTSPFLRMLDIQDKTVLWSAEVVSDEGLATPVIPGAVGADAVNAYVGIQSSVFGGSLVELHAFSLDAGQEVWSTQLLTATAFLTRPMVMGGLVFLAGQGTIGNLNQTTLYWLSTADGKEAGQYLLLTPGTTSKAEFVTAPSLSPDQTTVYVGMVTTDPTYTVTAVALPDSGDGTKLWQASLPGEITADLAVTDTAVFVAMGGTIVALNTADGSQLWSHQLSTPPVTGRPVVVGSALFVGSTDGNLYALDIATGNEQWRLEAGSAIVTDVVNESGILYFAAQGDGQDLPPAFFAVDSNSQGNDALSYEVPQADTILFVQGGAANGVVYFYGQLAVYAVNMSNLVHEFAVDTKLIVENYSIPTDTSQDPVGSDTSYRVTLTLRDSLGNVRPSQPIKIWAADSLTIVNHGDAGVGIGPDNPRWIATDTSGQVTLAVSAFDDGTPDGNPNVSCPPLYVWANFMTADEAIVIYPDHEQLTTLSNVQGSTPPPTTSVNPASAVPTPAATDGPTPLYLDAATGYDGQPLVLSDYQDSDSLAAIASTVRNTVGTRNNASSGATALLAAARVSRHLSSRLVLPNAVYAADVSASVARPYVPGSDAIFTVDLSGGKPVYVTTYDPTRPSTLPDPSASVGGIFSDIKHFVDNVVKGAEKVAKMAWQFTENAVSTVIHTAESVYSLVITTLEDAVSAVVGFLKSVIADVKRVIQWLSALFNWKNILANHAYIRNAISNPTDPDNPGVLDQLLTWVGTEVQAAGSHLATDVWPVLSGKSSAAVGSTATTVGGQTVQSAQAGGNDPNTAYNYGGNNNSTQCNWMRQKVNENGAGASVGDTPTGAAAGFDPDAIATAFQTFAESLASALDGAFKDLPDQISAKLSQVSDSFKDPRTIISTGLSDLMIVFQALADDFIAFAEQMAVDFLTLADTILQQFVAWLDTPITIPFVSDLYKAITHGDDLTILDLVCLLAAVPGTILLAVITGSPTVPPTTATGDSSEGEFAGLILLGIVDFIVGTITVVADCISLSLTFSKAPGTDAKFIFTLDAALDFINTALGMGVSLGDGPFETKDWFFWAAQFIPSIFNFVGLFPVASKWPSWFQTLRDTYFGVVTLVLSSVYAHFWPDGYYTVRKATGLILAGNIFSGLVGVVEVLDLLPAEEWLLVVAAAKIVFNEVSGLIGFSVDVIELKENS